jgi:hypothetical protein
MVPLVVLAAGWRHAFRFALVVGGVVAPWIVRNQVQLHHTVLTTSLGYDLAATYSQYSQRSGQYFVDPIHDRAFSSLWPERSDEARWDASLEHLGLQGLSSHPTRVLAVARYNIASVIGYHRRTEDFADRLDGRVVGVVNASRTAYYAVSLLGLAGLVRWRRDRTVRALGVVVTLLVALSMVTIYAPRLRAPFDVACLIGLGLLFADSRASRTKTANADSSTPAPAVQLSREELGADGSFRVSEQGVGGGQRFRAASAGRVGPAVTHVLPGGLGFGSTCWKPKRPLMQRLPRVMS